MGKAKTTPVANTPTVDEEALRGACASLNDAEAAVTIAYEQIDASGHENAERICESLSRVNKRLGQLGKRINPDAAAERERERKKKKIARLEERLTAMKAEIENA